MAKRTATILLLCALTPSPALAYLDPGTGSFILQMLIAGFLGALLYVRLAWDRTRSFFARLFGSARASAGDESPSAETGDDSVDRLPDDGSQAR